MPSSDEEEEEVCDEGAAGDGGGCLVPPPVLVDTDDEKAAMSCDMPPILDDDDFSGADIFCFCDVAFITFVPFAPSLIIKDNDFRSSTIFYALVRTHLKEKYARENITWTFGAASAATGQRPLACRAGAARVRNFQLFCFACPFAKATIRLRYTMRHFFFFVPMRERRKEFVSSSF